MASSQLQIELNDQQIYEILHAAKQCPSRATNGFEHLQLTLTSFSITMLGGSSDNLFKKTIPFHSSVCSPLSFSVVADFLCSALEMYTQSNHGHDKLEITITTEDNQATSISFGLCFIDSIRKQSLYPVLPCHIDAVNKAFSRPHQMSINCRDLYDDLKMVAQHTEGNFKAVYLKGSQKHITALVDDGHEITEYRWPNEHTGIYEIIFDDKTLTSLQLALSYNSSDANLSQFNHELCIDTGDQQLYFEQNQSLPKLKGKKPNRTIEDIKFIIDKFYFKQEIDSYSKIREIKIHSEAFLYFNNKNIMLFYLSKSTEICRLLNVKEVSSPYEGVFQFNPRSISASRIKLQPKQFVCAINHTYNSNYILTFKNSLEKGAPAMFTLDCTKRDDLKPFAKKLLAESLQMKEEDVDIDKSHVGEQMACVGFFDQDED
ncbi:hypothetical protein [Photobacterium rosenbergii]|uniref:hypothetical protein n=1 Tax=Photobacterium rosenbergii TaxID=294936 RepID=UPI001C98F2C3|nr:hypothetical protein [Photobacterium rosenbergii]MBY5947425.1 hypothetical protein [Photobacterium rosenbergii]